MSSRRRQIREAVRAKLLGATDAKDQVFTNQASASWSEQLPIVAVYTRSEDAELFAVSPREYKRTLQLMIEVIAGGDEPGPGNPNPVNSCENAVDELCEQIEKLMGHDETFGELPHPTNPAKKIALVDEVLYQGTEFAFRGEGDKPEAAAVMRFNVVYHTYEQVPLDEQEGIGNFNKANVEWPVGTVVPGHAQQENFEIEDDLAIPD